MKKDIVESFTLKYKNLVEKVEGTQVVRSEVVKGNNLIPRKEILKRPSSNSSTTKRKFKIKRNSQAIEGLDQSLDQLGAYSSKPIKIKTFKKSYKKTIKGNNQYTFETHNMFRTKAVFADFKYICKHYRKNFVEELLDLLEDYVQRNYVNKARSI